MSYEEKLDQWIMYYLDKLETEEERELYVEWYKDPYPLPCKITYRLYFEMAVRINRSIRDAGGVYDMNRKIKQGRRSNYKYIITTLTDDDKIINTEIINIKDPYKYKKSNQSLDESVHHFRKSI